MANNKKCAKRKSKPLSFGTSIPVSPRISSLPSPDSQYIYFTSSIDVPEELCLDAERQAKAFKLRKKDANTYVATICETYRKGYKKGEDKAAERAKDSREGTLRANERQMRRQQAAVAEAVKVLADVLRNNEVYGGSNGSTSVSD